MNAESLPVGFALPEYRTRARKPTDPSENKIHEDGEARVLGYRGALVPGVTVYAWMTHPIVTALGPAWLERGTFAARFTRPVYFGEEMTVRASVTVRTGETVAIEARVLDAGD